MKARPTSSPRLVPLLLLLLLPSSAPRGAYIQPQVTSLDALRASSSVPVQIQFRAGFPVAVTMQVAVAGATPAARARAFLETYADLYMQDHPDVELVRVFTDADPAWGAVTRLAQRYQGLPVFGAEILVQENPSGEIVSTHGALLVPAVTDRVPNEELVIDLEPAMYPETAEDAARTALGDPAAVVLGETARVIYDPGVLDEAGDARLAYRVTLWSGSRERLLIDAENAQVLVRYPLAAKSAGLDDFDLDLEDANGGNMDDTNCFNPTTIDDRAGDEDGVDSSYTSDNEVVLAWFYARETYLMYHDVLGRHSYDDDDGELQVYVHANLGANEPNARGTAECGIEFSNGYMSLDVLAHEFGHMVIDETSNLSRMNQPGALHEAFGDIMGARVDTGDWLHAEDRTGGQGANRDMADPTKFNCTGGSPCPDRMSKFVFTSADNGGVHTNHQIINKAYQLMADGGTFNGRTVNGFGRTKMARVAYRSFTNLASGATFQDARNGAVNWANTLRSQGLYGFTSADVCTVRNAFRAVEIFWGDLDCDGVEDNVDDDDGDGILDDGDLSGSETDKPCFSGFTWNCDDNCKTVPNPTQTDTDNDGGGDACDSDDDNDGIPDVFDGCPTTFGGDPWDTDGDGLRDCEDPDDDNDGVPDDGDGSGDAYDNPCPSGVTTGCDDNCQDDANPTQFDGDGNGKGDACDPDYDGDGIYAPDNCTFTANADQLDSDGDGLGDACDRCPFVQDNSQAWHPGYPDLGVPPFPIQPDSDGDGVPDACDDYAWTQWGATARGAPYTIDESIKTDGNANAVDIYGPPGDGSVLRLPIRPCDDGTADGLAANDRVELVLESFPPGLTAWVEDDGGIVVRRARESSLNPGVFGLRFRPRCDRGYFLVLRPEADFVEPVTLMAVASASPPTEHNEWRSTPGMFPDPPPQPPDPDGDGLIDSIDSCPSIYDPEDADVDGDGVGDVCDLCPTLPNPGQGPVEFPIISAEPTPNLSMPVRFRWDGGGEDFDFVVGFLDSVASYDWWQQGSDSGNAHMPSGPVDSLYYLYKYTDPCGTWGSAGRDAAF